MDKKEEQVAKNRWNWLPAFMPGVADQMKQLRAAYGNAHVSRCWSRSVNDLEPGWFWASQGALSVGVRWSDPRIAQFEADVAAMAAKLAAKGIKAVPSIVVMRELEGPHAD